MRAREEREFTFYVRFGERSCVRLLMLRKMRDSELLSLCNWAEATWSGIFVDLLLAERLVKWLPVQNFKQIWDLRERSPLRGTGNQGMMIWCPLSPLTVHVIANISAFFDLSSHRLKPGDGQPDAALRAQTRQDTLPGSPISDRWTFHHSLMLSQIIKIGHTVLYNQNIFSKPRVFLQSVLITPFKLWGKLVSWFS